MQEAALCIEPWQGRCLYNLGICNTFLKANALGLALLRSGVWVGPVANFAYYRWHRFREPVQQRWTIFGIWTLKACETTWIYTRTVFGEAKNHTISLVGVAAVHLLKSLSPCLLTMEFRSFQNRRAENESDCRKYIVTSWNAYCIEEHSSLLQSWLYQSKCNDSPTDLIFRNTPTLRPNNQSQWSRFSALPFQTTTGKWARSERFLTKKTNTNPKPARPTEARPWKSRTWKPSG